MRTARTALMAALLGLGFAAGAQAAGTYDPGATDSTIKIGNTWPFSGPASGTATLERQMAGYFNMVNDEGGINGRKIDFISLDDGYSPPKTVEDVRRLVEQDKVLLMFGQLGTPTNMAVRPYLNSRKIPQLFVTTGSNTLVDPAKYPYTLGFQSSYALEGTIYAKYLLAEHPNAKIGVLYQDDDFGSDHLGPFLKTLGDKAKTMVVAKASYSVTDPTVTSQILSLQSAGADTLYLIVQGRAAPQAVTAAHQQAGWNPLMLISYVATTKGVIGPAGDEAMTGLISCDSQKNPADPNWANEKAAKDYLAWVKKYVPQQDWVSDNESPTGYLSAELMAYVLKKAGNDLTRANIMKAATSLNHVSFPLLLPGVTLSTSKTDYFPVHTMQLKRYDGKRWVLFGNAISG